MPAVQDLFGTATSQVSVRDSERVEPLRDHVGSSPRADAEQEEWRPIPSWCGDYEASDLGRIRSVDRVLARADTGRGTLYRKPGRILKSGVDPDGHTRVVLCRDQKMFTRKVHRLVLEAFVGPCPDGMECCHNNGDPADNRLDNLRWDTLSSNAYDRVEHGVHNMARRDRCNHGHLFAGANLTTSNGYRSCRACRQARVAQRRGGRSRDWFLAEADRRYALIMGGAA